MIKNLQKKICILFICLLSIIWIGILYIYTMNVYRNNLLTIKQDMRHAIRDSRWRNFIKYQGTRSDLGNVQYCVYSVDDDNQTHLLFHTFSDKSDAELLSIGQDLIYDWSGSNRHMRYTYIYKYVYRTDQKYIIFIGGSSALRATLPTIGFCILLLFAGIFAFARSGQVLSRWLTQPIADMLQSEKQFISNASHELKTPLAVIRASADLLQKEVSPDNKHLLYIHQETDRMITLVNQMLTLTRLDTQQHQSPVTHFQADAALYDIIYPMESVAFEKGICITTDIQENMYITGAMDQIQNLLSILLNNAISYTPDNGRIHICAYLQAKKLHLEVANTGTPIPPEQRKHLFERFFRGDESHEGNGHFGLGLSIANSIVVHHHGSIYVDYKDQKNIFYVVLPV